MRDRKPICVYTAIYGNHDSLKEQPTESDVDYVCWTDQLHLTSTQWEVLYTPFKTPPGGDRLAAKESKCRPDIWLPRDYEFSIWIDASIQIKDIGKLTQAALEGCMEQDIDSPRGIAMFRHPDRDCIYDEADLSMTLPKYDPVMIKAQITQYAFEGWPKHAGLWAGGIIARGRNPRINLSNQAWHREILHWSDQDQLSLPVVLHRQAIEPGVLPGNLWSNNMIEVQQHRRQS